MESDEKQPVADDFDGLFFNVVAEFSLEVGGDFVVIERVWENTGFPSGTDAEAFRTVLDHRPQLMPGQIGAFLLRREDALALAADLTALSIGMMDFVSENIKEDENTHLIPHEEGFIEHKVHVNDFEPDVRYPGFDWKRPDEEKSDQREPRE